MACLSVSSDDAFLPSQVKSSPSAPDLIADSAFPALICRNSTTRATARGLARDLFLPTKPMPPLLWARRAFVNRSFNLLILMMFLLINSRNTMEGKKAWTASHLYDDQCVDVRGVTVILADTFEFNYSTFRSRVGASPASSAILPILLALLYFIDYNCEVT